LPANPLWKPIDRRLGAAKSDLPRIAGFEARVSDALVGWSNVPWLPHHPRFGSRMGAGHHLSRPSDGTIHHIEGVEGVVGGEFVEARAGRSLTNFFCKRDLSE
jgi:hypothetical protein